ncbi:histidyl-tRNA synthetase [Pilibacter termitis]|uniref:Histidine--tRNA ligase n=1 Tax=Pilibacter termitis TaxID=263852 RepID=A0A1T4PI11_9ENTE|nr:histidine--tRNA ligase [Pilibacter termitis]SJZ91210.1 histidyl-tRNA synthetase [Pilibacter termitis]
MKLQRPKGTNDILPSESYKWQFVEEKARLVFGGHQYQEIRTPLFEHYEVISRSVGDTTDIVSKEMYDFYDKGERHITLRPEGTAPVVRAFVENKLFAPEYQKPYKVYYAGAMFRYERMQKGRYRQFHQIGAEVFGSDNPATDVESMAMVMTYFEQLGIKNTSLHINTLGNTESRANYRKALIDFLMPHFEELSEDSKRRLHENPLRVLDSKDAKDKEVVKNAPSILDFLDEESSKHFETVKTMLEALEIPYVIDTNMVRGLDYYNHTIFELMATISGKELTVAAGGRYDKLVEYFGGPETSGFGFALGIERLLLLLEEEKVEIPNPNQVDVYVVSLGEAVNVETLKLVQSIRKQGFSAERDFLNRKAKAQFKTVDKLAAKLVITIGEGELEKAEANVKNADTREEKAYPLKELYRDFSVIYDDLIKG